MLHAFMARSTGRILVSLMVLMGSFGGAAAQKGYNIKVKLDNYASDILVLGMNFGEKQYVKDTIKIGTDGQFVIKADSVLKPGVYLLVLKPDNNFIQVMMPADDQEFSITADVKDMVGSIKFKGSEDNTTFYDYMRFLAKQRPESDTLKSQFAKLKSNKTDSLRIVKDINAIDERVKKYQRDMVAKYPNYVGCKIVKASMDPEVPEFKGAPADVQKQTYYWYRDHYFDNINLADSTMIRTPVLHQKIDYYINKLTPQHPDTINKVLDAMYARMKPSPEIYKYYVVHFLNHFAQMKLVGFDACYVHVGKNYYCPAPWPDSKDKEKVCDNVARLEPILIGKIAPNIIVKDKDNKPVSLYDVDADYTVLFFWAPDCGHCKKAAPDLVEFAKNYKSKGVKVFNVCTAVNDKAGEECWKGIEEKQFSDEFFINTYDPYIQSRYKKLYDVQTTPQIFILDRKHEILMKRIEAKQISTVMDSIMKMQEEKKKKG
jgi:thiol-disulfide isomerase/thioredoxin